MLTLAACGGDRKSYAPNASPETTPTMVTRSVESLISDSGITRYRIVSPLWLVYDEARDPHWRFPDGLHLERYDDMFRQEATIDCDSATYFKNRQLWRLDGHVRVLNMAGERFLTQQLFWDSRNQKVYSDSFIHIERTDRVMEGYGFVSNQSMTDFSVRNVQAILPVERREPDAEPMPSDSISTPDTTATVPGARRPLRSAPRRPGQTSTDSVS